jgi:hypothetical protein
MGVKRYSVRLYPPLFVGGCMSYLCYFCLFTHSGVKYVLTKQVTWWVSYKRQELLTLREHLCSPSVFGGVHVAHLFSFLCCVFLFCLSSSCVLCTQCSQCLWIFFVLCLVYPMFTVSLDCLRPVSCVPNVTSVSGLSSSCVLCTQCSQCLWIVHSWMLLQFSLTFIWFGFMALNVTFNNFSVILWRSVLLVAETRENHRPVASHWQTLSHNVVHLTLIGIWTQWWVTDCIGSCKSNNHMITVTTALRLFGYMKINYYLCIMNPS